MTAELFPAVQREATRPLPWQDSPEHLPKDGWPLSVACEPHTVVGMLCGLLLLNGLGRRLTDTLVEASLPAPFDLLGR